MRRKKEVALPLEKILLHGDLQHLTDKEKLAYYKALCASLSSRSVKMNPLARPFEYLWVDEGRPFVGGNVAHQPIMKQILYATRNCTDQLRAIHKISVVRIKSEIQGTFCVATVEVSDRKGRTDIDTGVANSEGAVGQEFGNCVKWAVTQAKRRATLSICGLGSILDESELKDLGSYNLTTESGRKIVEQHPDAPGYQAPAESLAAAEVAGKGPQALFWTWYEDTQIARISGAWRLKEKHHDLLQKYWNERAGTWQCNAEKLEFLKKELAELGVPFEEIGRGK